MSNTLADIIIRDGLVIRDSAADHDYTILRGNLAADRTVTLPVLTSGDTFAFEDHSQTLSNKTLISPTITGDVTSSAGHIELADIPAPSNPGAGKGRLYKKVGNDGLFWKPDVAGPEIDLTAAAMGGATFEQFTLASLGIGATWTITHGADGMVTRLVQVFRDITASDTSLTFTSANESSFTQEDSSKTEFVTNNVQLEGSDPDLLHLWRFEDDFLDAVGSLNGTGNGTFSFENNPITALDRRVVLDNSPSSNESYASLVDQDILIGKSAVSWTCWFRMDSDNGTDPRIITRAKGGATDDHVWMIGFKSGTRVIRMRLRTGSTTTETLGVTALTLGVEYFGAWVYNGSNMIMYLNNASVEDTTAKTGTIADVTGTTTLTIGGSDPSQGFQGLDGRIDQLAIWDKALSPAEISTIYNSGSGKKLAAVDTTQGWYVHTNTNQIDSSTWSAITTVTVTEVTPASTSIKYMVSFDGRTTWYSRSVGSWVTVALGSIDTGGMDKATLEALVESDWDLQFAAGTLDFVASLKSTDSTATPELSQITVNYELPGLTKVKDSEITVNLISSTTTDVENISGRVLEDLRAHIVHA